MHEPVEFVSAGVSSDPFEELRARLKLARTIADLARSDDTQSVHLAEAL